MEGPGEELVERVLLFGVRGITELPLHPVPAIIVFLKSPANSERASVCGVIQVPSLPMEARRSK